MSLWQVFVVNAAWWIPAIVIIVLLIRWGFSKEKPDGK